MTSPIQVVSHPSLYFFCNIPCSSELMFPVISLLGDLVLLVYSLAVRYPPKHLHAINTVELSVLCCHKVAIGALITKILNTNQRWSTFCIWKWELEKRSWLSQCNSPLQGLTWIRVFYKQLSYYMYLQKCISSTNIWWNGIK